MRLYHRTPAGDEILVGGFRDSAGTYGFQQPSSGVWLADTTLTIHEGATGNDVLVVEMPEDVMAAYERTAIESPYREFQIPAVLLNRYAVQRLWRCDNCCGDDLDPNDCPAGKAFIQKERPVGWLRQHGRTPFGEGITVTLCNECAQEGLLDLVEPVD